MKSTGILDYSGSWVALVTPFKDGAIDEAALRALVSWHIEQGTSGILACGTTGEAATISPAEWRQVVRAVVEEAAGRVPVMAGSGSNDTRASVQRTQLARELGADCALVVTPYYNKPTPEGQYQHFRLVAEEGGLPIVIYNIPGRTGTLVKAETIERLADLDQVVGLKDATGNVHMACDLARQVGGRITLLSGEDDLTLPLMALGYQGVISATANVAPGKVAAMVAAGLGGDWEAARRLHEELLPLTRVMFIETNPIPAKTALAMIGRVQEELRLPMCQMGADNKERLRGVLESFGLPAQ